MSRLFFKSKRIEVIYKRDLQSTGQLKKSVYKMHGESRTSYNIQSAEDGWVQVSIHKFQVIFAFAESSRSSQTEWAVLWLSSFSIFPISLHKLQLLMSHLQQFLRSQQDRWSRISPMRNKLATYRKYHNEQVFLSAFQFCIVSHFKTITLKRLVSSQV